jgi:hypothetical protein
MHRCTILIISLIISHFSADAQAISGVWRGKIRKNGMLGKTQQLELKLVRTGDSLQGTAYYYAGQNLLNNFPVRGYFDPYTGTVSWQEMTTETGSATNNHQVTGTRFHFIADFNCPDGGVMQLDGKGGESTDMPYAIHLDKVDDPIFPDDWDVAIRDMQQGKIPRDINNPATIPAEPRDKPASPSLQSTGTPQYSNPGNTDMVKDNQPKTASKIHEPPGITALFNHRQKKLVRELPLTGDSLELRFYDHAEIDGDSIALFLNNRLLQEHILLKATPFIVKLAVAELPETIELTMVAENLGSIPPNTSLMITYIEGQRYEAMLESTEWSSAMIRFTKPPAGQKSTGN